MVNWRYFIPFAYFISSRLKTPDRILSWIIIYPVSLLLAYVTFAHQVSAEALLTMLAGMAAIYTVYELGYLANDSFTVKSEVEPTLRLTAQQQVWIEAHWNLILTSRLSLTLVIIACLLPSQPDGLVVFCCSILLVAITFYFYNRTRGAISIPLHFILVVCRFSGPCMLVMPEIGFLAFTIVAFPLINLMERAAEPRYKLTWAQQLIFSNQGSGRWLYYLIMSLVWAGLTLGLEMELETVSLLVFLFLYRLISPLIVKHVFSNA